MFKVLDPVKIIKFVLPVKVRRALIAIIPAGIIRKMYLKGVLQARGETHKARPRRDREFFFNLYCRGKGLDIGYGGDLLSTNCKGWDLEQGDAQYLKGIKEQQYDFVYSSHTLEHMPDPDIALRNWWRVVKPGGYLILYIPDRDLYEKKTRLPSRWNPDHKHFFLLKDDDKPDTLGIIPLIQNTIEDYDIIYAKICSEGHTVSAPEAHSDGEYSIEVVIKKQPKNQSDRRNP